MASRTPNLSLPQKASYFLFHFIYTEMGGKNKLKIFTLVVIIVCPKLETYDIIIALKMYDEMSFSLAIFLQ